MQKSKKTNTVRISQDFQKTLAKAWKRFCENLGLSPSPQSAKFAIKDPKSGFMVLIYPQSLRKIREDACLTLPDGRNSLTEELA